MNEQPDILARLEHIKPGHYETFVAQTLGAIFAAATVPVPAEPSGLIRIGPGDV